MLRIGLTGGIGSGKSTVARLLAERGFPVIDADLIARQVVEPGQPALADLASAFGSEVLLADGTLDRSGLAARAFATPEATATLNSITHPRIQEETARQFAKAEAAGEQAVIHDIPLLVEMGYAPQCDLVVVVDVDVDKRVERLVGRGISSEDARRRIAAQIPDEQRLAYADVVIDNNGSLTDLPRQVDALVERIQRFDA